MAFGPWQIVIIVLLIVVFFGRGKISGLMGDVGKGITSFRKGLKEGAETESVTNESAASAETAKVSDAASDSVKEEANK